MKRPTRPLRVAMLAHPDVQMLDVVGPLEVFSRASRLLAGRGAKDGDAYRVEIIGLKRGLVSASSGLGFRATRGLADAGPPIDTLLVAGGRGTDAHVGHPGIRRFLRREARRVRRLGSICTGAFLLADAGLLDDRPATTHWASCEELAERFPRVRVEPDRIFVKDGAIYTSAGVTSGMDLALALVEEDYGRDLALATARALVMYLRRPGGQAQFSAQLAVQFAEHEPLRDLQAFILEHPERDHSVDALARRVAMSPRSFARHFTREVGATPARFVTSARVETARRRLEESHDSLDAIGAACGFGSLESMRRAFLATVGVAPGQYRERFARRHPAEAPPAPAHSARRSR
jgi:transcriptional regulator GlxA family with amidase domain